MQVSETMYARRRRRKRSACQGGSDGRSEKSSFEFGHSELLRVKSEPQFLSDDTRPVAETQRYRTVAFSPSGDSALIDRLQQGVPVSSSARAANARD
jgi:hypothetical protein